MSDKIKLNLLSPTTFQIDGAEPENKEIRTKLFAISGLRAKYPQCFINNSGAFEFIGQWEAIETLEECDSLPADILASHPEIKTFTRVFFKERSSKEVTIAMEKARVAQIAKKMEEQRVADLYLKKQQQLTLEENERLNVVIIQQENDRIELLTMPQQGGISTSLAAVNSKQEGKRQDALMSEDTERRDNENCVESLRQTAISKERTKQEEGRAKTAAVFLEIRMREEELERLEAAIDKRKAEKQERENAANGSRSGSGKTDGSRTDRGILDADNRASANSIDQLSNSAGDDGEGSEDEDDDDDDDIRDPRLLSLVTLLGSRGNDIIPAMGPSPTSPFQSISSAAYRLH